MSIKRTKYNGPPPPRNWGTWAVIDSDPDCESRFKKKIRSDQKWDEKFALGKEFNERVQAEQLSQSGLRNKNKTKPAITEVPVGKYKSSSKRRIYTEVNVNSNSSRKQSTGFDYLDGMLYSSEYKAKK